MGPRTTLLTALLLVNITLAGCVNLPGDSAGGTTTTVSATPTGTTTATATPTETATTTTTTTTETTPDTTGEPQKGDNLLSVTAVDTDTVEAINESVKADFSELSDTQQAVFLDAHDCDCNVNQDVFRFNDEDQIEYVRYEGQWYFLRVSIV